MDVLLTFKIAMKALAKNKMRAGLTTLGVIIGIAAVTTMVSVGQSASQMIRNQLSGLGTNVIWIVPKMQRRGGVRSGASQTLTAEDADAIPMECDTVLASSAIVGAGMAQMIYGNSNWNPKELLGVGPDYLIVRDWELNRGGFFNDREITSASKVCVIGRTVAKKLFQTANPIGEAVRVKNIPFRVIGILEEKGANMFGEDQDDIVLIPYTTVQKRLQGSVFNNVHAIVVSARVADRIAETQTEVAQLLQERHGIAPGAKADFEIQNTTEIANIMSGVTNTMTAMLAAIAGISLLVGGVGIMNIMLVSVTERTREIGIRMAVGARGRDILRQFLVESIVLSCVGGTIGLLFGLGASYGLITVINSITEGQDWPMTISIPAAVVAILFSAAVGMFFGFYPARKASKLDPIDALRYE
ncbi:ABC transporter permease [bacterium]|nr:ABC transporter permease [bacterium]